MAMVKNAALTPPCLCAKLMRYENTRCVFETIVYRYDGDGCRRICDGSYGPLL